MMRADKRVAGRPNRGAGRYARSLVSLVSIIALLAGAVAAQTTPDRPDIRGAWRPETYTLKDGPTHPVRGLIFFTATDWTVLFFVTPGDGAVERGSGEGGTYTLEGSSLVFTHLFNLSAGNAVEGIPASPLRMAVKDPAQAATESCRVRVEGDRMTIQFPSGNAMVFRRSSGF